MIGADDGGVNTIKTHTSAIYRKLAVTSRAAAVTRAAELGLLTDSH
jgi:ATP/maltotriose-dependent transcriptional regulator MalT